MQKTWIVLRHEVTTTLKRRGFWLGLIIVPMIGGFIALVSVAGSSAVIAASLASRPQSSDAKPQGYVDAAGVFAALEASGQMPADLHRFDTEAAARAALAGDAIVGFYLVPPDVVARGNVEYVSSQFSPFDDSTNRTTTLKRALELALLNGDAQRAARFRSPVKIVRSQALAPPDSKGGVGLPFSPAPIVATVLFFTVLMTASSYLMNGVTGEKENRVMEVLMSSVTPTQLLVGKILGLSLVGLLQLGIWVGSIVWLVRLLPMLSPIVGGVNVASIAWAVVFLVLGYFIYATLMAGLGAIMPTAREAAQYTFFIILPLMLPLYAMNVFMTDPNGTVATALSIFPLTAPVAMIARLSATDVPTEQLVLSAALTAATMVAVVFGVVRVFRAQMILSGSRPGVKQILGALRG